MQCILVVAGVESPQVMLFLLSVTVHCLQFCNANTWGSRKDSFRCDLHTSLVQSFLTIDIRKWFYMAATDQGNDYFLLLVQYNLFHFIWRADEHCQVNPIASRNIKKMKKNYRICNNKNSWSQNLEITKCILHRDAEMVLVWPTS